MGLEQDNGTDIQPSLSLLGHGVLLQAAAKIDGIRHDLLLAAPIVDDDRQLDHVLPLQRHRVHITQDIALSGGRGCQIEHKARVEVLQHLPAQRTAGMMTLVHDHKGRKLIDDLQQGGFICVLHGVVGGAQRLGHRGETAVFLLCLQLLLASTEGVIGQHHDGKLLRHCGDVEILAAEKLFLGIDLHLPAESGVDFHSVGMIWVAERRQRLGQNGVRGNQPYHGFHFGIGQAVKNRLDGIAGQEGLSAACRDLQAEVRDAGQDVLIGFHAAKANVDSPLMPKGVISPAHIPFLVQKLHITG